MIADTIFVAGALTSQKKNIKILALGSLIAAFRVSMTIRFEVVVFETEANYIQNVLRNLTSFVFLLASRGFEVFEMRQNNTENLWQTHTGLIQLEQGKSAKNN